MGNSSSKKGKVKVKKGSDDGCIGNRRVRTIVLSILLVAFCCFAAPYIFEKQEIAADRNDSLAQDFIDSSYIENQYHAYNIIVAGLAFTVVGAICAIVLFFIPGCDDKLGKGAGFILLLGGILYIFGWIWTVVETRNALNASTPDINFLGVEVEGVSAWDAFTDEQKQQTNAEFAARCGEALLMGLSAILLGVDAALQWYDDEAKRLSSNLGTLIFVSLLTTNAYWLQVCGEDETICFERDGVEAIAFGYTMLFIVCTVYVVLYICTCCTCDCKDKCLVRVALAIALVVGGVITSIGYYVYSGGAEGLDGTTEVGDTGTEVDTGNEKFVAFYIGYSILIGGLPIVWALDIALDDVKNR